MLSKKRSISFVSVIFFLLFALGCVATQVLKPHEIAAPQPLPDNSGEYMCPYTKDDVVAPWCDKAINASIGSTVGKTAGAVVGSQLLKQVPFVGGFLGSYAGEVAGRAIAIEMSGGWEYIKETSDQSFNTVEDLCVWMYATKSNNEHFQEVFKATSDIYPEFAKEYSSALGNASKR